MKIALVKEKFKTSYDVYHVVCDPSFVDDMLKSHDELYIFANYTNVWLYDASDFDRKQNSFLPGARVLDRYRGPPADALEELGYKLITKSSDSI